MVHFRGQGSGQRQDALDPAFLQLRNVKSSNRVLSFVKWHGPWVSSYVSGAVRTCMAACMFNSDKRKLLLTD